MNEQHSRTKRGAALKITSTGPPRPGTPVRYDFRETPPIAAAVLPVLQNAFNEYIRHMATSLSLYLEAPVKGGMSTFEQISFSRQMQRISEGAGLVCLKLAPCPRAALLQLDAPLVGQLLSTLFGSSETPGHEARHLTELEIHVLRSAMDVMIRDLREAWKKFAAVEFKFDSVITDPGKCDGIASDEPVLVLSAELRVLDQPGTIALIIPAASVASMLEPCQRDEENTEPAREQIARIAQSAQVRAEVALQGARILASDLLQLRPGQVLTLPHAVGRALDLAINGTPKFKGQVVAVGRSLGFQVDETRGRTR